MIARSITPGDAFLLPPMLPRSADLLAGGGFGVVVTVNRTRGLCLVFMQNGSQGEIAVDTVRGLLLVGAAA